MVSKKGDEGLLGETVYEVVAVLNIHNEIFNKI